MLLVFMLLGQIIDFQQLYDEATTSLVQFQTVREAAIDSLVVLGKNTFYTDTVVAFLVSKFDTKGALERHIMKDILKEIGEQAVPGIVDRIDKRGSDGEDRQLAQSLWVLGEIGSDKAVEAVSCFTQDGKWQIRSSAYTALGKMESRIAVPYIVKGLSDSIGITRKSAFYALSTIACIEDIPHFIKGLADEFYGVRYAAVKGLEHIGAPALEPLLNALGQNTMLDMFVVRSLLKIGAHDTVCACLDHYPPEIRYIIYEEIPDSVLLQVIKDEPDPMFKAAAELLIGK
jgi:HEAT repeat protein